LSNHEAELIIALRAEGMIWRVIAEKMEVSIATCRAIVSGHRRGAVTGRRPRGKWWGR
jgi:hypothetical protein